MSMHCEVASTARPGATSDWMLIRKCPIASGYTWRLEMILTLNIHTLRVASLPPLVVKTMSSGVHVTVWASLTDGVLVGEVGRDEGAMEEGLLEGLLVALAP